MRIARILTRLNLGGPARQVLASDPLLVRRGYQLRLFCGRPEAGEGDLAEEARAAGLDVVSVPGLERRPAAWRDLRAQAFLRRALAAFDPDVVHTHAFKAGWLGRTAARRAVPRAALVHTFHGHVLEGYFPAWLSRALIGLERRLARRTDRVLAVSRATADDLVRLGIVDEQRLSLSPPGIRLDAWLDQPELPDRSAAGRALRERWGVPAEACLALQLGRLAPVKRPQAALDVFARAAADRPHLWLAIVGDGPPRAELEERLGAWPADLRRRVLLPGALADAPAVHAASDMLLLTSRNEGWPVAVIEAAAAGRAVVAPDVGGLAEALSDPERGLLAPAGDDERLALHLGRLVDEPQLARRLGATARAEVRAVHSAEALANRLEQVYREVLAGRAPREVA
jgi:glycosyltransferase involved in cell wall biosynthesis